MNSRFLTNYTDTTFLSTIQANLRVCKGFMFSVSFIKKAGLVLLANDIKSALERGAKGRLITSTYQLLCLQTLPIKIRQARHRSRGLRAPCRKAPPRCFS